MVTTNRLLRAPVAGLCVVVFSSWLAATCGGGDGVPNEATTVSSLWGTAGEQWVRGGRLTDFSYAGYHRGERPLPRLLTDVGVTDFGAVGDGTKDDTAAIQRAVSASPGKVIGIPAGRYVISDVIELTHNGTVLQGAGPENTVLFAPKPLEHIRPNMGATTTGRPTSNYSWSGGIIRAVGRWDDTPLAEVTAQSRRGDNTLEVDRPDRLEIGDLVRLVLQDDSAFSLTRHLYADDPGDVDNLKRVREEWIARIVAIDLVTKHVTLDRALRTDVRLEWRPVLYSARSTVEEVGIEELAIEFPVTPYGGHFTELGFNAIALGGVHNGWVRNVEIRHADSGIFISGANNTITGVRWTSQRQRDRRRNSTGHHGITLGGSDQLLSDFDFRTKFIHDVTMSRGSAGNVVRDGRGEDLTFDHHCYANHANLFTNVDAGVGTDIFRSGGGAKLGRHCGAWTTWWNIKTERPVEVPAGWATDMINVVGVLSEAESVTEPNGRWFEVIAPERLTPPDLYESQWERRLRPER